MTSTFFANTNSKIRELKEDKSYPVIPKSGLNVIKRGKSKYFEGRMRFPFNASGKKIAIPIGVFEKDLLVKDAIKNGIQLNYGVKRIIKVQNYLVRKKKK